ncbi:MAG: MmgE/PrpD family protein, partial [Alphaproteobacteria bacterium]
VPTETLAEQVAEWAGGVSPADLPDEVRRAAGRSLLDIAGLCLAARHTDYVRAVIAACDGRGDCTAFGHEVRLDAAGAALVNGTAAHGEDFDDTFEGTPVHPGSVSVPAVLAACESHGRSGADALKGMAVATETMCRLALVAPTAQHRAGFHPTAIIGTFGAAAGVAAALGLPPAQIVNALGIAGSMASGIIEYLAEGAWTKRLHPGWAAQSGYRAARLAAEGFQGPRTVFEGEHGFFFAFGADGITPDYAKLTGDLGETWRMTNLAFKPHACGTICQPFVDIAIRMARDGIDPAKIAEIRCKVGEGTVHRLWQPRAEKISPTSPYGAKFSVPFCIAMGFVDQAAGLDQFVPARIEDPCVRSLAAKIHHEVDPKNQYPDNYTGHLRVTLEDGSVHEATQPHLRGGRHDPLSDQELTAKFFDNASHGGWRRERAESLREYLETLFERSDLDDLSNFRD